MERGPEVNSCSSSWAISYSLESEQRLVEVGGKVRGCGKDGKMGCGEHVREVVARLG